MVTPKVFLSESGKYCLSVNQYMEYLENRAHALGHEPGFSADEVRIGREMLLSQLVTLADMTKEAILAGGVRSP